MKNIYRIFMMLFVLCLLSACGQKTEYDQAFLNQKLSDISKIMNQANSEKVETGDFSLTPWDYVESVHVDLEKGCLRMEIYDITGTVRKDILEQLDDADYIQFLELEPLKFRAEVIDCGEWNGENGRQTIEVKVLEAVEWFEQGQTVRLMIQRQEKLILEPGTTVTAVVQNSGDATDPPRVYAYTIE